MAETAPKAFISYSWTSDEHGQWVFDLATQLVECGVDVILDKWDLKDGHDVNAFMEQMESDPDIRKVIVVCDRRYAEKADRREGGVGAETQIITPEIYARAKQDKFVAVVTERDDDGNPYVPVYFKSRLHIDLGDPAIYATNFERLVRWVFDRPLYEKPALGKPPEYLSQPHGPDLGTTAAFKRALDAIRNGRSHRVGAVSEYFDRLAAGLEILRIPNSDALDHDDRVVATIDQFLPFRNEAVQVFHAIAQQGAVPDEQRVIHRFLEQVYPLMHKLPDVRSWREWDFDNFRFVVHELLLYLVAAYLRYERFENVNQLFAEPYYVGDTAPTQGGTLPFASFWESTESLSHRSERLKLGRLSLRADLLKDRTAGSGLRFEDLMQADFAAFMRDCVDVLADGHRRQRWWPDTLVFSRHVPFEIFARAQSTVYFNRMKVVIGVNKKSDCEVLFEAFRKQQLQIPHWLYSVNPDPAALMGYDRLATMP